MDIISQGWLSLLDKLGLSDRIIFLMGVYLVSEILYLAIAGFYFLCWTQGWFMKYRIQKKATMPEDALIKKCINEVCIRSAIARLPFLYCLYDLYAWFGMEVYAPLPPVRTIVRHWMFALVVNDTLFYWIHRLMHHRVFYKTFHKKHHEFKVNISVNSEYASLAEVTLCDVIPTLLGCLLLGSHLLVSLAWTAFRVWETCAAHSGYAFPWCPFSQLPFFNGPQVHDYHHSHNVGTYGAMTRFWDALMHTDKHYQDYSLRHYDPYIPTKGPLSMSVGPLSLSVCGCVGECVKSLSDLPSLASSLSSSWSETVGSVSSISSLRSVLSTPPRVYVKAFKETCIGPGVGGVHGQTPTHTHTHTQGGEGVHGQTPTHTHTQGGGGGGGGGGDGGGAAAPAAGEGGAAAVE